MIRYYQGIAIAFYKAKIGNSSIIIEEGSSIKKIDVKNKPGYCFRLADGCIYVDGGIGELIDFLENAPDETFGLIMQKIFN